MNGPCLHEQIHGSSMAVVLVGACLKNHFRKLHAPLLGIFYPINCSNFAISMGL